MAHKLLLADDSVTIQRVIELTFADEDVQVTVVGDGKQAVERILSDRPDIVLADIGMPGRDGYDVAAFIKGDPRFAHIPVVLLTGAFEPLDENRARSVGCDAVLIKPFEPQMVINRVKELLSGGRPVSRASAARPEPVHPAIDIDSDLAPPPAVLEKQKSESDSLEDYFDRLDAAFANVGAAAPVTHAPVLEQPDLSAGLGDLHQPPPQRSPEGDALSSWDPDLAGDLGPSRQPDLASAFAALLAAEQGHVAAPLAFAAPAPMTDDAIDEIVRRVIARMSDDSMRRLVSETAERVVREEIDRIKKISGAGDLRSGG